MEFCCSAHVFGNLIKKFHSNVLSQSPLTQIIQGPRFPKDFFFLYKVLPQKKDSVVYEICSLWNMLRKSVPGKGCCEILSAASTTSKL